MKCRHCASSLQSQFLDLGVVPPSNKYLTYETLKIPEKQFPLRVMVCEKCWLVQTEDFVEAEELFDQDYCRTAF